MKIHIKELGAIKEGVIDLSKKINIFCGLNGTGKTYMAYVIYALTKLNNKSLGISLDEEYIKNLIENDQVTLDINYDNLWAFKIKEIENIKKNLWNLFALSETKSTEYFSATEINVVDTKEDFIEKIDRVSFDRTFKMYDYTFKISKFEGERKISISIPGATIKNENFYKFLEIVLLSRVYSILSFYPITSSVIFPVERNSIYTFSNELSIRKNDALDHIQAMTSRKDVSLFDLVFKRSSRYPQPIRDGLEVAEDLETIQKRNSPYYSFALEIEKELLKGKVFITKDGGNVEFASDKAPKIKLSFHQTSSIVKTLASLVIYLKHNATENDLVIIDEPELNLHPDNQVKLARIFARLVNEGLRVLISTHSDYIVRELNNLIMVSSTQEGIKELAQEFGYHEKEYLLQEDVGAYIFNYKNPKAKKTEVIPIRITSSGFEVSTLDTTIENLNKRSDELYYTLKYGKAE